MSATDHRAVDRPLERGDDVVSPAPPGGRRRAGRKLVLGFVVLVVALVWAGAVASSVARAAFALHDAQGLLLAAERSLGDGDLSEARDHLRSGVTLATSASDELHAVHVAPLRFVPGVSSNLASVTALSDAARDVGGAAEELLETAARIVHDGEGADHGEISLEYLRALRSPLRGLAEALARATGEVEAAGSGPLVGPVAEARTTYLGLAGPMTEQAAVAADLVEVMPTFLGADGPRTYLVGAGALSELRASGGLMGSWSTMTADGGRLDFEPFLDIDVLASVDADVASPSADFTSRYAELGALRHWRNANLTPDFPSAARVMLELWEGNGRPPLDGVIMADPVTFERIAERSGPLEVPGAGALAPAELLRFVALDAYAAYDDEHERKAALGAVATASFARAFDILEDDDVPATVRMLAGLADGGHLRVFSREAGVQEVLHRAGVSGALPEVDGEFAGVFVNNVAANKVDYFTTRHLEHRVRLLPDGASRAVVGATFSNTAPRAGYPREVLGPWTEHTDAGDNLSLVSVVCGVGCSVDYPPDTFTAGGSEGGRPLADVRLLVPAGQERTIELGTRTTGAWWMEDGDLVVPVSHVVQPTLRPSPLRVALTVPEGWTPAAVPDGTHRVGDELVWEEAASGVVELTFRLSPTG